MKPGEEKVWLDEFPSAATPSPITPGATTPCLLIGNTTTNNNEDYVTGGDNGYSGGGSGNHHLQLRSPHRRSPLQVRFVDETAEEAETQMDDDDLISASQPILLQLPTSTTTTPVKRFIMSP